MRWKKGHEDAIPQDHEEGATGKTWEWPPETRKGKETGPLPPQEPPEGGAAPPRLDFSSVGPVLDFQPDLTILSLSPPRATDTHCGQFGWAAGDQPLSPKGPAQLLPPALASEGRLPFCGLLLFTGSAGALRGMNGGMNY